MFTLKIWKHYVSQVYWHNFGQNVINGVNLVKIGHFWWKWSKSGHFGIFWGPKWRHMSKFWESGQIIFSWKVSKNYFSQVYRQKFGQNVINGVNLVKIGHFLWKLSILGHFGPKNDPIWRHRSKFGESGQEIFTLKIWKNYVSQVYWHNFGQKCH